MYGNPTGFEQSMYDDAAAMAAGAAIDAAMQQNNQLPNQTMQVSPKKGLKGIFGKKKGTAQYQNAASQLNAPQPVQGWQQEVQTQQVNTGRHRGVDINTIKQQLKPFASRGNSIVVTGCGGCGTSTIAYNLANIVHQLGYSVLLVDMDTEGRTQSYISKTNYDSMEPDGANLMSAVNSSTGTSAQEAIVKQGFHLLTMGLGTDTAQVNELLHKEKISRFANLVKSSHDFVIYDIPFKSATDYLSEITYTADNLVLVADASNWGITKLMLNVCNISADDMQDTIFNRAQLVFNKYRNLTKVFGRKVRTGIDITKIIDMKVQELIGEDPGFHFEDLHIAGILNDDPDFEQSWFEMVQYSDTQKGQAIFLELLEHIVLKK
jgi:Mrp family chromosome partitioning ATPase